MCMIVGTSESGARRNVWKANLSFPRKKSWSECVKADVDVCNLEGIDPKNREAWRSGVRMTSQLQPTPVTGKLFAV